MAPHRSPLRLLLTGLAALGLLVPAPEAAAQGFGFNQHSACSTARAGAAVARPCWDGSAVFYNPAALVGAEGWTASLGAVTVLSNSRFVDDRLASRTDQDSDPRVVPHLFVRHAPNEQWAFALGVYAPYGFSTGWPPDFEGAFISFDSSLEAVYIQPTVAYQLHPRLALGAGPVGVVGSVELNRRADLSEQAVPGTPLTWGQLGIARGTGFADVRLRSTGATGVGGHVGLQAQLHDRVKAGVRFLTPVRISFDGSARFRQVETGLVLPAQNPLGLPGGTPVDQLLEPAFSQGPLVDQEGRTEIRLPAQVVAGVDLAVRPDLFLAVDYQWTNWSTFDRVELRFTNPDLDDALVQSYGNAATVRAGVEYRPRDRWSLLGGYLYNEAAAPDETVTPLVPEGERNHWTLGLGWQATPSIRLDGSYHLLLQNDRRGRTRDDPTGAPPTPALNDGVFEVAAHLFGFTLTLDF